MELTVWVDGIQRVISGANDSTTCQDVVIALASAVGRTGRFTLIEKWRDKQRALYPGDCPLQSLHRRGEYASEVRFYLVQAEIGQTKQQEVSQQKWNAQSRKLSKVFNNFMPPQQQLKPVEAESLKRSSTFSCAHRTNFAALPVSSKSSSQNPSALSQYKHDQQASVPPHTSSSRGHPAGHVSVPNGELKGLSSTSSSDSSPRSSSTSLKYNQNSTRPLPPARRDARELHPANTSNSSSSPESALASFQQLYPPIQHSYPRKSPKPLASSSALTQKVSYQSYISSPTTAALRSSHSQQLESSLASQQSYPHSGNSQQLHHAKAVPLIQLSPSSVENENIFSQSKHNQRPAKQRERSRESKLVSPSSDLQSPSKSVFNGDKNVKNAHEALTDVTSYDHSNDNVFYDDTDETQLGVHVKQNDRTPDINSYGNGSGTAENFKPKDIFEAQLKNRVDSGKTATLGRHIPRSKMSRELPSKSLETSELSVEHTKSSHERNLADLNADSDKNQQKQVGEGNKLTFVDSALIRHQKPSTDGNNQRLSSFTSAVAHVRNNGNALLKAPKTETHVKQHVSDSSFKGVVDNVKTSTHGKVSLAEPGHGTNAHNSHHHFPLQSNNNPPVLLNSISSSRHNSAFTEVSPKSSHQNSASSSKSSVSPVSPAPVAYNLDDMGASRGIHQKLDPQTSLEIEEYDLDQNFPNVRQRDITSFGGDERSSLPSMNYLEDGMTSIHLEEERIQFLSLVCLQEERMRTQEAQINAASLEIASLEEEESNELTKSVALASEVSQLEKQETEVKVELQRLEMSEWSKILENEQKWEVHVKLQITSLKEKLEQMESQIKQLNEEADQKSKELKVEEERIRDEQKQMEEIEQKTMLEMTQLKDQLADMNKIKNDKDKELKEIEKKILEMDTNLKQQEEKVNAIEEELKGNNSENIQVSLQPEEHFNNPMPVLGSVTPDPVSVLSSSDNGEAILKILEGQLSPHSSAFHSEDGGDSLGGITSAQHMYKSPMAAKNPNGVWV